jgi:hypothetical protein
MGELLRMCIASGLTPSLSKIAHSPPENPQLGRLQSCFDSFHFFFDSPRPARSDPRPASGARALNERSLGHPICLGPWLRTIKNARLTASISSEDRVGRRLRVRSQSPETVRRLCQHVGQCFLELTILSLLMVIPSRPRVLLCGLKPTRPRLAHH